MNHKEIDKLRYGVTSEACKAAILMLLKDPSDLATVRRNKAQLEAESVLIASQIDTANELIRKIEGRNDDTLLDHKQAVADHLEMRVHRLAMLLDAAAAINRTAYTDK